MNSERAIVLLNRQKAAALPLRETYLGSPEFAKWHRDTEVAIEKIFSANSRHVADFQDIDFSLLVWSTNTPKHRFQDAYARGLKKADAILQSMVDEIRDFEFDSDINLGVADQINLIERICLRFHASARQLQSRYKSRATLTIEDEYDVQDFLHAILRLHFDDIRPEEWTPSYAGKSSRVDFLLKNERIVIEVKKTRASLLDGKIGEELIIDRARYEAHPDCDTLVCFVYDPEERVGNPIGLERDLENFEGGLNFRVIIAPKS
jgi:hypothetical protein